MKIPFILTKKGDRVLSCPDCRSTQKVKNGTYTRKWFHTHIGNHPVTHKVQRYLCHNPHCPRRTFSVLPPEVMPYCRFLWFDIVQVFQAIDAGKSFYSIARKLFNTAIANCVRLGKLLSCLRSWISALCLEHDELHPIPDIESGINQLMSYYSWFELKQMWYRFFYPKSFTKGVINIV